MAQVVDGVVFHSTLFSGSIRVHSVEGRSDTIRVDTIWKVCYDCGLCR